MYCFYIPTRPMILPKHTTRKWGLIEWCGVWKDMLQHHIEPGQLFLFVDNSKAKRRSKNIMKKKRCWSLYALQLLSTKATNKLFYMNFKASEMCMSTYRDNCWSLIRWSHIPNSLGELFETNSIQSGQSSCPNFFYFLTPCTQVYA